MHTNPILICFCSILYYRDLAEHIRRYKIEKELVKSMRLSKNEANDEKVQFFLKKFGGKLSKELHNETSNHITSDNKRSKRVYNKFIVNRWHVLIK